MSVLTCPACSTPVLLPGAPWCSHCYAPLDAPSGTADAPVEDEASIPVPVAAAAVPAFDFAFAVGSPPAAPTNPLDAPPADAPFGWRPPGDPSATLLPAYSGRTASRFKVIAVLCLALLVGAVGVGGTLWYRSQVRGPKAAIAKAWREARPPGFIPQMPDFSRFDGGDEAAELPGEAAAFVRATDPQLRELNDAVTGLGLTFDDWARDKVDDATVVAEIEALDDLLDPFESIRSEQQAPASTTRGLAKLASAMVSYRMALGALLDWIDSENAGAKTTFHMLVGTGNQEYDDGMRLFYRAGGLEPPPSPHPTKKKK